MKHLWSSGNWRIELLISEEVAHLCSHPGPCDDDIERCMQLPEIKEQIDKINPETLADEISEYSDWDCSDHNTNLMRLLWIACGDILESIEYEQKNNNNK